MSAGRRCGSCGARAVHRAHRQGWQRWVAWIVPLRPQHCIECSARSWGLLRADEGLTRYAAAAVFWLLVVVALWPRGTAAPPPAGEGRIGPAPVASPVTAAPFPDEVAPARPTADAPAAGESAVEPEPAIAEIDVSAEAAPPAEARQRAMRLDGIDVRWAGEAMEVVVRGGDGVLFHTLRLDANVQGYLLDLPGRWTLPNTLRMTRSFERSNLLRMRVGRHRDFLRIVFSLRDPAAPEPQVERSDGMLRILIR